MSRKYINIHIDIKSANFITRLNDLQSPILFGQMTFSPVSIILSGENTGKQVRHCFMDNLFFTLSSCSQLHLPSRSGILFHQFFSSFCVSKHILYLASPIPVVTLSSYLFIAKNLNSSRCQFSSLSNLTFFILRGSTHTQRGGD